MVKDGSEPWATAHHHHIEYEVGEMIPHAAVIDGDALGLVENLTEQEMMKFLGKRAGKMWKTLSGYLDENYEFEPIREEGDLDSTIRYRRSGKTLITFYPKKDELTILIIFGKKEAEKFEKSRDEFSPEIVELFDNTKQYHDGRWLHIKVPTFENLEDIKKLLHIKRKPRKAK